METGMLKSPTPFCSHTFAMVLTHATFRHPSPPSHPSPHPSLFLLTILCLATLSLLHRDPSWCLSSQTSHWVMTLTSLISLLRKNNRNKRRHSVLLLLEQQLKGSPVLLCLMHHCFLECPCHFVRTVKETTMSALLHQHSHCFKHDLQPWLRSKTG